MSKEELYEIKGGSVSAAMINAVVKAFETIYDMGRALGSAIKRSSSKVKTC